MVSQFENQLLFPGLSVPVKKPTKTNNAELHERFLSHGSESLTNRELLTIITGDEKLSGNLMEKTNGRISPLASMYASEMKKISGGTELQVLKIMASLELGKRKAIEGPGNKTQIKTSEDLGKFMKSLIGECQYEKFVVIFLNRANIIKKVMTVSEGGITGTVADSRVILKHALLEGAVSIVLSHNHPSGSLRPSRADEELTAKIKSAAALIDITVLDHIIVSQDGYFSFADEGII